VKCPIDKSDMIVVEHRDVELDYCTQCQGVWFDSGELDLLISKLTIEGVKTTSPEDLLLPHGAEIKESKRKCPICTHKMDKVWIGSKSKVLIDSCTLGDGLWFDGGELHQVLHQIGHTDPKDILSFLGDALQADQ
jgi:uncharacterized protein